MRGGECLSILKSKSIAEKGYSKPKNGATFTAPFQQIYWHLIFMRAQVDLQEAYD